jgi:hypothetical protein
MHSGWGCHEGLRRDLPPLPNQPAHPMDDSYRPVLKARPQSAHPSSHPHNTPQIGLGQRPLSAGIGRVASALPRRVGPLQRPTSAPILRRYLRPPAGIEERVRAAAGTGRLDLTRCGLQELPAAIQSLGASLLFLSLAFNKLDRLNVSVTKLSNLRSLDLSYNALEYLPDDLGKLQALVYLALKGNELTTLPDALCQLTCITWLDIRSNSLASLPDNIGEMRALTRLDADSNLLETLPASLGCCEALTRLSVSSNTLTWLPVELGDLAKLEVLDLSGNALSFLPPEYGALSALKVLNLEDNPFTMPPTSITSTNDLKIILPFLQQRLPPHVRRTQAVVAVQSMIASVLDGLAVMENELEMPLRRAAEQSMHHHHHHQSQSGNQSAAEETNESLTPSELDALFSHSRQAALALQALQQSLVELLEYWRYDTSVAKMLRQWMDRWQSIFEDCIANHWINHEVLDALLQDPTRPTLRDVLLNLGRETSFFASVMEEYERKGSATEMLTFPLAMLLSSPVVFALQLHDALEMMVGATPSDHGDAGDLAACQRNWQETAAAAQEALDERTYKEELLALEDSLTDLPQSLVIRHRRLIQSGLLLFAAGEGSNPTPSRVLVHLLSDLLVVCEVGSPAPVIGTWPLSGMEISSSARQPLAFQLLWPDGTLHFEGVEIEETERWVHDISQMITNCRNRLGGNLQKKLRFGLEMTLSGLSVLRANATGLGWNGKDLDEPIATLGLSMADVRRTQVCISQLLQQQFGVTTSTSE